MRQKYLMTRNTAVRPRIVAMEYQVLGHYPDYIRNIAEQWHLSSWDAEIEFIVSNRFASIHGEADQAVRSFQDDRIHVTPVSQDEEEGILRQGRQHYFGWELFRRYCAKSNAAHGLLMYLDNFQLPIWLGKKLTCSFSAIYFRPTFHYHRYLHHRPSFLQRLVSIRKKWFMKQVLRCPQLKELYVLDPTAIDYIRNHFRTHVRISHFADTFPPYPSRPDRVAEIQRELGIEKGRKVFTLLGVLDSRKGPIELLQSVSHLDDNTASKMTLMLLGYTPDDYVAKVKAAYEIAKKKSFIQLIYENRFIPGTDIQNYFAASDVILITYQGHMGSSLALIRAAAEGKPLLSSNFGTVGELVEQKRLGITVDSTDPRSIAKGITRLMTEVPRFDSREAKRLVDDNSCEQLRRDLARMFDFCITPPAGFVNEVSCGEQS